MTINVWLNSAWYNGVPLGVLVVPAGLLVALAVRSFRRSWRIGSVEAVGSLSGIGGGQGPSRIDRGAPSAGRR
jgi:hypothetical protein